MTAHIILTVLGSDRPGLTQSLAEAVLTAGGNWLESHLSRLGGMYVGSVLVEIAEDRVPDLETRVRGVDSSGLKVTIVNAGEEPASGTEGLGIELVGQDRPGIVREVTTVLARIGANIEAFESSQEPGAWSGEPLFRASAQITLPGDISAAQVREALEAISGEIMVDFSFG